MAASAGTGAVAGRVNRNGRSPVGSVRDTFRVWGSGADRPVILEGSPLAASNPLITEK